MKKLVIVFLSIIFTASCAIGISACNVKPDNGNVEMPHAHNYGEWIITKSATCTDDGAQSRYCVCGDVQTIPLGATGHSLQSYAAQAPTCTEKGWDAYDNCKNCEYTTYSEISALGHDIVHHEGQAATYSDDGWEEYDTCSRCDYSTYKKVPALKHNLVEHSGQAATCTDNGWYDYVTCTDCDYSTFKIIPALGHSVQPHAGREPTCTEKGWKAYETCARCDYSTYEELSALGHSLQPHAGQEPTCTENGWIEYETCARCDYSTYEELSAVGHSIQLHSGKEPTCTEIGWRAYETCARCDYSTYEELSALGHFVQSHAGQEPTCTEKGWKAYETCARCDYSTFEELSAMGHDFSGIYRYDSSVHWHECLNDCGATDGKFKHAFTGDDSCSDCGYAVSYTQNLAYTLANDGTYYKLSGIGDAVGTCVRALPEVNGKPVKEVEANAFAGNAEITELYLPESVTEIGACAFENCRHLAIINLFDKYTSIGERAFAGTAYYNERANWQDNILYIGANLISVRTTTLGITNIKEGTTIIADGAYSGCANVVGLEIPDSVRYIGENVFNGCTSIESISIPDCTEEAGFLTGLTALRQLTIPAHLCASVPKTIQSLTITSGDIADGAFKNFTSLISININSEVNSIGNGAFKGCNKIENITLPFIGKCKSLDERDAYATVFGYIFGYTATTNSSAISGAIRQYSVQKVSISGGTTTTSTIYYWYYIPTSIKSVTITGTILPDCAFYNCNSFIEVSLPNGISEMGSSVFYNCSKLEKLNYTGVFPAIPNSLFCRCVNLKSIIAFEGVTTIGDEAFYGCRGLTDITIPDGVITIGEKAFYGCSGLIGITIPDRVITIGNEAFYGCSGLTSIFIPDDVMSIGKNAFYGSGGLEKINVDNNNEAYASQDGILYNKQYTKILYVPLALKGDIAIPDGVESIDKSAFSGRAGLTDIYIPNSLVAIGSYAFSGCAGLTEINLPENVQSIGESAFNNCNNLRVINVDKNNSCYASQDGILFNKAMNEFIHIPISLTGSVTIPETITSIAASTFADCAHLTKIVIPDSVTYIGTGAFKGCIRLESMSLPYPSKVTELGTISLQEDAVFGKIFGYTIAESLLEIPQTTCQISYIGSSSKIHYYYLYNIPQTLNEVNITSGNISPMGFNNCKIDNITLGEGVEIIYDEAFRNCTVKNLTLGSNVSSIKGAAFQDCSSLTSVTIPDSVKSIGGFAFRGCNSLTSVTIPNRVTSIGGFSFEGCSELTKVNWKATACMSAGNSYYPIFSNCNKLTTVRIGDNVTTLPAYAFQGCSSLTSVTIPDSVTSIGEYAFYICSKLSHVYYGGTAADWENISIEVNNSCLESAERYYYSEAEPSLNSDGTAYDSNYWFYDSDGITPVKWKKENTYE